MKKGLSQIILGRDRKLDEWLPKAKACGYEGMEILLTEDGDLPLDATESDFARLRQLSTETGVELCSICASVGGGNFSSPDPADRERRKEITVKQLQAAQALGIQAVLVVPGGVTEDVPYPAAYDRNLHCFRELALEAEKYGVAIALEYVWNKMFLSPLEMRRFLDEVGSEYVGFYMDTGNMLIFGYAEQWIDILGEHVKMVHFKDFKRQGFQWVQLMEGDVNWKLVMEALRRINYDNYVISEVGSGDDWETHAETARRIEEILKL